MRAALEEQGAGRVLVVDGGASKRCALLGDNIAEMAHKNGWTVSRARSAAGVPAGVPRCAALVRHSWAGTATQPVAWPSPPAGHHH